MQNKKWIICIYNMQIYSELCRVRFVAHRNHQQKKNKINGNKKIKKKKLNFTCRKCDGNNFLMS